MCLLVARDTQVELLSCWFPLLSSSIEFGLNWLPCCLPASRAELREEGGAGRGPEGKKGEKKERKSSTARKKYIRNLFPPPPPPPFPPPSSRKRFFCYRTAKVQDSHRKCGRMFDYLSSQVDFFSTLANPVRSFSSLLCWRNCSVNCRKKSKSKDEKMKKRLTPVHSGTRC